MEKPTLVLPLQFPSAFGTDFAPVAPPVREDGERKPARLFAGGMPPKQASKTPYTAHLLIDPAKLIVCGRSDGLVSAWKYDERSTELKEVALGNHIGAVNTLALDAFHGPSGIVFSGSADGTIRVWDPYTKDPKDAFIQSLLVHDSGVNCVAFGSSGSLLISGGCDGCVCVSKPLPSRELAMYPWFEVVQVLDPGRHWITSLVLLEAEGSTLVFFGNSLGDLAEMEKVHVLGSPMGRSAVAPAQTSSSNSRARSKFLPGSEFCVVRVFGRLHRLSIIRLLLLHESGHVCTLSNDGTAKVIDYTTGALVVSVENRREVRFKSMFWNPGHQEWYLGDEAGWLTVWSVFRDSLIKEQQLSDQPITSMSFTRDTATEIQRFAYTAGSTLCFFTISRSAQFVEIQAHSDGVIGLCTSYNQARVIDAGNAPIARASKDARVFSAGNDSVVRCWDGFDMSELFKVTEKRSGVCCVYYLASAELIVFGLDDGSLVFWNPDSKSYMRLKEHNDTVTCVCSARGRGRDYLLSSGYDGRVIIWDVTVRRTVSPEIVSSFSTIHRTRPGSSEGSLSSTSSLFDGGFGAEAGETEVLAMCFDDHSEDPGAHCFATAGNDRLIKLWNAVNCSLVCCLEGHTDSVTCLAVFDGILYSGSEDCSIRVWDINNPAEGFLKNVVLSAHSHTVRDICVYPRFSDTIVSVCHDGSLKVWYFGPDGSSTVAHEYSNPDKLNKVVCTGHQVIAGSAEGRLLVYPLPNDAVAAVAPRWSMSNRPSRRTSDSRIPAVVVSSASATTFSIVPPSAPASHAATSLPRSVLASTAARSLALPVNGKSDDVDFWGRRDSFSHGKHTAAGGGAADSATGPPKTSETAVTSSRLGSSRSMMTGVAGASRRSRRFKADLIAVDPSAAQLSLRLDALAQARDHLKVPQTQLGVIALAGSSHDTGNAHHLPT